jgi:hypothetical protein
MIRQLAGEKDAEIDDNASDCENAQLMQAMQQVLSDVLKLGLGSRQFGK